MKTKKITLATVKTFIKKNQENLMIKVNSDFDSMTDSIKVINGSFEKANQSVKNNSNNLGIDKAWFVGSSRDYFTLFEDDKLQGIEVHNACGSFTLAINK